MAQSNWACAVLSCYGKLSDNGFRRKDGKLTVYKNWLEFKSPECLDPVRIYSGAFEISGWNVLAVRGPDEGVYFAVWGTDLGPNEDQFEAFVGFGVFGCDERGELEGIRQRDVDFLQSLLNLELPELRPLLIMGDLVAEDWVPGLVMGIDLDPIRKLVDK